MSEEWRNDPRFRDTSKKTKKKKPQKKIKKKEKSTQDDDWWRKELGIHNDNDKETPKRINQSKKIKKKEKSTQDDDWWRKDLGISDVQDDNNDVRKNIAKIQNQYPDYSSSKVKEDRVQKTEEFRNTKQDAEKTKEFFGMIFGFIILALVVGGVFNIVSSGFNFVKDKIDGRDSRKSYCTDLIYNVKNEFTAKKMYKRCMKGG
tara:strand:- start:21 stop:629 length:609 start_codon:yes stop_codon:yes gene_type:complete